MFNFVPSKPDWYYTFVNIPNLEKIEKELLYVRNNLKPALSNNQQYINFLKAGVEEYIPTLREYFEDVGVYDKLYFIVFSATKEPGQKIQSPCPHVDRLDKKFIYALNIPLVDCENTYTAWYEGPVEEFEGKPFGLVQEHLAKEICRVETTKPMLVNTSIPHMGLTTRPNRVLSSLRFIPDLTEEDFNRIITKE